MPSTLGTPHLHLRSTDSTNARAYELAAAGAPHGTLVTAGEQTAGRGRQGRTWVAPAGQCLLCSIVFRDPPPLLSLMAGAALAELVARLRADARVSIKWPNDVLLDDRKVAGILAEGRPQEGWAVIGIGLNVALDLDAMPAELRSQVGTLDLGPAAIDDVLAGLVDDLEQWTDSADDAVIRAVRERDALRHKRVRWATGSGTAHGIDGAGRLVVRGEDGTVSALDAGEVHLERGA